ncbi:MAG TPA: hypothetical protein ENO09_04650, partial [bacterium]|nr:hypothetical protein [bacterium]
MFWQSAKEGHRVPAAARGGAETFAHGTRACKLAELLSSQPTRDHSMATGFFALLDDIAMLLDDTAAMSKV